MTYVVHEHGTLPEKVALQLDNAGTNKNALLIAWLAMYVYFGVSKEATFTFKHIQRTFPSLIRGANEL